MSKWKSAIRHNLSSHSFFLKTSHKNSQGHFWSIEANYFSIIRQKGTTIGIKKCLGKKTHIQKPKQTKQRKTSEPFFLASMEEEIYNQPNYNDSAFFSSTENDNSQHSFISSSSSGYQNYKFLSPTHHFYMPQSSSILDNANVNFVHLPDQLSY